MNLVVDVQYALDDAAEEDPSLPTPAQFEAWVAAALAGRRDAAELSVRVVEEAEGAELNHTYRHRAGPTNVLSFPCDSPADFEIPLLGDIVICAPVVAREARAQNKTILAHWAHLTVHGSLHLLGYDHETPVEAEAMEALETDILAGLGIADPYAAERAAAEA